MIKSLDIGATILSGYRFPNGLFIAANYNAGLNNLFPGSDNDGTIRSHYLGIRLGWLFKEKIK